MTVDHLRYDKNHEEYLRVGRNLLDDLTRSMALSGIGVGHDTLDLPDGNRIIVSSRNGGNDIEIIPPEKRPVVVEKIEEKEEEEEGDRFFFAVAAKVLSSSYEYTRIYLGVWEPDQSPEPFSHRIVDNRDRWNWGRDSIPPEERPLRELPLGRATFPDISSGEDRWSGYLTTCRYNDNGMFSFSPRGEGEDGILSGYYSAIVIHQDTLLTDYYDTTNTIETEILPGEYTIKVATDGRCEARDTTIEIRILTGIEGDEDEESFKVISDETHEIAISIPEDEATYNNKYLIPYGEWRNKPTLEDASPPRCFNSETLTKEYRAAEDRYGANPHASNYWQGAFLVEPKTGIVERVDDLVPETGFEPGTSWRDYEPWAKPPCVYDCTGEPIYYIGKYTWYPTLHLTLRQRGEFVCSGATSCSDCAPFGCSDVFEMWTWGNYTVKGWHTDTSKPQMVQDAQVRAIWERDDNDYFIPFSKWNSWERSFLVEDVKTNECSGSSCLGIIKWAPGTPTGVGHLGWWCERYPEMVVAGRDCSTTYLFPGLQTPSIVYWHVSGSITVVYVLWKKSYNEYVTIWAEPKLSSEYDAWAASMSALRNQGESYIRYTKLPSEIRAAATPYIQSG